MPNGGMMPCCWVCQWATHLQHSDTVHCRRHDVPIFSGTGMFCADLSHDEYGGLAAFVRENAIKPGTLYIWFTMAYQDPRYPTIPQYAHEYLELATIAEYAAWPAQEKLSQVQAVHRQRREELHPPSDDNPGPPGS